jgi:hypothetical protein
MIEKLAAEVEPAILRQLPVRQRDAYINPPAP